MEISKVSTNLFILLNLVLFILLNLVPYFGTEIKIVKFKDIIISEYQTGIGRTCLEVEKKLEYQLPAKTVKEDQIF